MADVTVVEEVFQVVVAEPGPQGPSGSSGNAFTPAADSGTGSAVDGSFTITGGTNVTTSVSGTTVTVNSSGTVTEVLASPPLASDGDDNTPRVSISNLGITSAYLAVDAVQTDKISDNAVTADKLNDIANVSGDYTNTNLTVDGQGRITAAASGTAGGVTSLVAGDRINVSAATGTVTISHKVKTGTGTNTNYPGSIEVDAFGHVVGVGTTAPPAERANNLSDLANKDTAITNLGGTTVGSAVFKAADAAAARTAIGASPTAGSGSITTVGTITSGTWSGTAIAYASLLGKPSLGTASQYNAGIGSNSILQADANVADDDFLRVAGTKVEGRTAAEVRSDIGADNASNLTSGTIPNARINTGTSGQNIVQLDNGSRLPAVDGSQLTNLPAPANNVTSPAMTGVSAGSITGVIRCSQSQYDAITHDSTTAKILYVIV